MTPKQSKHCELTQKKTPFLQFRTLILAVRGAPIPTKCKFSPQLLGGLQCHLHELFLIHCPIILQIFDSVALNLLSSMGMKQKIPIFTFLRTSQWIYDLRGRALHQWRRSITI